MASSKKKISLSNKNFSYLLQGEEINFSIIIRTAVFVFYVEYKHFSTKKTGVAETTPVLE